MKLAPTKARLGATELDFLGHSVSSNGVRSNLDKVSVLTKIPMPKDVSQVRSLLGHLPYHRKYLPNLERRVRNIPVLLKQEAQFDSTSEMTLTVRSLLKELSKPPVLAYLDWNAVVDVYHLFHLYCYASKYGFGASLEQQQTGGDMRPLVFLGKATLPSERNWSALEKEAGAIAWSIKRSRGYLFNIPFVIPTDYMTLQKLSRIGEHNSRVQQWLEFLSAYKYTVKCRKGTANGNADVLSRLPQPPTVKDLNDACRLTNPTDVGFCVIGAGGIWSRGINSVANPGLGWINLAHTPDSVVGGLTPADSDFGDFRSCRNRAAKLEPASASHPPVRHSPPGVHHVSAHDDYKK